MATKADIAELCRDLGAEIESISREIKESEYRLTSRLGGMMAAAIAIVAALVKLL